ncbi:hypothetical protein AaE_014661 [Aphanomyces astaci]|uniref:Thioredoxin-like fold domain-containing protein n=1 Tax=Aphanomyces astaci TaxID=112090 RepID=A0A6A4Z4S1_APHAT|nr:hypothetical protein AaE_014661 [Aphanomyces astaci]
MTHFMKQTKLVNAAGAIQEPVAKTLALYFAADWCPDCRDFQPKLNDFYSKVNAQTHQLDIQGPWLAIPFHDTLRDELKRKYQVCAKKEMETVGVTDRVGGIPTVVIVTSSGDVVDIDAASKIESSGVDALAAWL